MSQVIRIPTALYQRLEQHAEGFDTPANVIERILDFYEIEKGLSPEKAPVKKREMPSSIKPIYYPSDPSEFKRLLVQSQKAYVLLHYTDGRSDLSTWNASKFTKHSDLNSNVRSGYLRDWKDRGIIKAEFAIDKEDLE